MTAPADISMRMERVLNAPVQRVFEALTTADQIPKWYGPSDDFTVTVHTWDARVGGQYRVEFNTPAGETHIVTGEFREIVPNARLVYTWSWEGQPPMDTLVTFALTAQGGQTRLVFTHDGFRSEEARGHHEQGWTGSLERLTRAIL